MSPILRLWICVFGFVYLCDAHQLPYPELKSLLILNDSLYKVEENIFKKLLVEFRGENLRDFELKLTKSDNVCDLVDYQVERIWMNDTVAKFFVLAPKDNFNNLYFCVRESSNSVHFGGEVIKWRHSGENLFIKLNSRTNDTSVYFYPVIRNPKSVRRRRSLPRNSVHPAIRVKGIRVEHAYKEPTLDENGIPVLLADAESTIRLFGEGFTEDLVVTFTQKKGLHGGDCQLPATDVFHIEKESLTPDTVKIKIRLPPSLKEADDPFYICAKRQTHNHTRSTKVEDAIPFVHQGVEFWLQLKSYEPMIPLWASIIIIIVCLSFSALFSGLNLGLMALDRTELKILCNTGNESERKHAKTIQPVRDHGNYLLCSILLGNVLVNSIFTILLDDLTSGFIAVIFSTLAIVMFGEISPQAVCSRHGLAVGARTIYITKAVMLVTAPLSYPISKILDVILGEEIGNVYNRERLKELVKVTTDINDLDKDEVNIVTGALELRKKTVSDVMTKIEDVFMLDLEAILDFETVSEIMKTGFSRIPVYEGTRQNIVTVLYIKDLAFVDPDDNTPLKTLCQFYQNPCNFVFDDLTLDIMFKEFKEGNKGHMAFVHRVNNEGEGDPFYEVIGLVTLEDVIEELIQSEIVDETDVFTDNQSKKRINKNKKQDFSMFAERKDNRRLHISPQLTLATYQYLSASVDLFKPDVISEQTLKRLLKQDIFCHIKRNKDKKDQNVYIYQQGKPVDFYVMILEGRVEVTVGKENLVFEGGPFTYFGLQALMQNVAVVESPVAPTNLGSLQSLNMEALIKYTFQPDYSVRAVTDVLYMKVRRSLYLAAKRATLMERSQRDTNATTEQFDAEMEKLLCSLDDEDTGMDRMSPNKQSDKDIRCQDSGLMHSFSHGSQSSPRIHSANTSPASFSPRDLSTNVNGIAKFSPKQDDHNDEETTLLDQKSDTGKS